MCGAEAEVPSSGLHLQETLLPDSWVSPSWDSLPAPEFLVCDVAALDPGEHIILLQAFSLIFHQTY